MRDVPFSPAKAPAGPGSAAAGELAIRDCLQEEDDLPAILTAKEREIVGMVREGASNKLIARQLDISLSTVKTHLRNIFAKTEVVNRTELVSRTWMPAAQRTLHL